MRNQFETKAMNLLGFPNSKKVKSWYVFLLNINSVIVLVDKQCTELAYADLKDCL